MGGFFGQLLQGYGENIIQKQKTDMDESQLEQQQQKVAMGKMQMLQAQQKQQSTKDISMFMKATQDNDASTVNDPIKTAQMYEGAAAVAVRDGNFQGAEELNNLAKSKRKDSTNAQIEVANKIATAKEDFSEAASNYSRTPTPEMENNLMRKALAAGINPSTLPSPGSPGILAFAKNAETASMSGKERAAFYEKQNEFNQNKEIQIKNHADEQARFSAQMRQTAILQAGLINDHKQAREEKIEDRKKELADKRAYDAVKQSPTERQNTNAIVASASEAVKGFKQIMDLPSGQQAGFFSGLHDGTMLKSLEKNAGSALTQRDAQMYNVATSGLSLEIGRVLTLGGGRGVNKAQLDEFKEMATVRPGEDNYVAMYKLSNAADTIRNRMLTLPDSANPKILAQQREVEKFLENVPTTAQVQASADKAGRSTGKNADKEKMNSAMGKVGAAFSKDEEQKGVSSSVQAALDKYK